MAPSGLTGLAIGGTSYLKNFTAGKGGNGGSRDVPLGGSEGVLTIDVGSVGTVIALATLGMVPVLLRGAGVGLGRWIGLGLGSGMVSSAWL